MQNTDERVTDIEGVGKYLEDLRVLCAEIGIRLEDLLVHEHVEHAVASLLGYVEVTARTSKQSIHSALHLADEVQTEILAYSPSSERP